MASVRSNLGEVHDLSPSGMCVIAERIPASVGKRITIELFAMDFALTATGEIVWTRRTDRFKVEFGVRFVDLSSDAARNLTRLAEANQRRESHQWMRRAG